MQPAAPGGRGGPLTAPRRLSAWPSGPSVSAGLPFLDSASGAVGKASRAFSNSCSTTSTDPSTPRGTR